MNYWRASAVRAGLTGPYAPQSALFMGAGGDGALPGTGAEYKGSQGDGCDGSWSWRWSRALHPASVWEAIMSYYVSAVSDRARNNWPKIFEKLGIFIPPNHRHGPCPCCGVRIASGWMIWRGAAHGSAISAAQVTDWIWFPASSVAHWLRPPEWCRTWILYRWFRQPGKITGFEYGIAY